MEMKKVPIPMQHQVRAYLRHADEQMETLHDIDAIHSLSPTLQRELAFCIMEKTVNQFGFFKKAFGEAFVRDICQIAQNLLVGPDDVVYQGGHITTFMTFVATGKLRTLSIARKEA